jgi:hypothetical protein
MMNERETRAARLQRLLQALREKEGLPVGPREEFAAFQVLAALELANGEPRAAAELRSHLKPLISKSAREGELFDARFRALYPESTEFGKGDGTNRGRGEGGVDRPAARRASHGRAYGWVLILVAACLAAIWIIAHVPFSEIKPPTPDNPKRQDTQASLATDRALPAVEPSGGDGQDKAAQPPVADANDAPRQAPISWWLFSLLLVAPALGLGIWIALVPARRRAHLRRMARGGPSKVHTVEVRAEAARELSRVRWTLALASRMLHSRAEVPSQDIDPERTVLATVRNGGFFTPVVVPRRVTPEYLVLVTSAGPDDHQAERMSWLVQQIVGEEVAVDRYFIEHNANRVYKEPRGRRIALKQLFDRHPQHRLLVMGTGEVFLRPGMQGVWPWAEDVRLWDHRALATPLPKEEWGFREGRLSRLFEAPIYPATSEGLRALGAWFQERSGTTEERPASAGLPPRTWHFDSGRWLARAPADPDGEWQALRGELAGYLDEAGLDWLRACAVYPSLRWDLTVLLGVKLQDRDRAPLFSEARATRLCLLPWFRTGFLPDWLRRRLIDELAPNRRKDVTDLIARLLSGGLQEEGARTAVTLPIEVRATDGDDDTAQGSPADDAVFLEYMTRQGGDALAIEAPRSLADRLLGPRRRFREREQVTLLAGLAALLILGVAVPKPWHEVKASPSPPPKIEARKEPAQPPLRAERPPPPQGPILRIDPLVHTAAIRAIGVDTACTVMATGSSDKTVRLWSLPEGKLRRTLRPPIGPRFDGAVYAVALAPDGSWVAAGGPAGDGQHFVNIFESATGALATRLGPLNRPTAYLTRSPDGRFLGAGLLQGGLLVWEAGKDEASGRVVANWRLLEERQGLRGQRERRGLRPQRRDLHRRRRRQAAALWSGRKEAGLSSDPRRQASDKRCRPSRRGSRGGRVL